MTAEQVEAVGDAIYDAIQEFYPAPVKTARTDRSRAQFATIARAAIAAYEGTKSGTRVTVSEAVTPYYCAITGTWGDAGQ